MARGTIYVDLHPEEKKALLAMSQQDIRPPFDQIRWLVVREAIKRGLLPVENCPQPEPQPESVHA